MKNHFGRIVAATTLALALGCASEEKKVVGVGDSDEVARTLKLLENQKSDYRISPQDLLAVSVYQEEDLKKEARVSMEGKISFPLAGEIVVGGLTPLEAEAKIREILKAQFVDPQVSVEVKEYRARRVFVLGEVVKPGSYEIPPDRALTVVEAIALAGGFTKYASPNRTRVVRRSPTGKDVESMVIPVASVTRGDKEKDVALKPDDVIYIPETIF